MSTPIVKDLRVFSVRAIGFGEQGVRNDFRRRGVDRRGGALVHQRAGQRVQRARHRSRVNARGFCNVAHGEGFLVQQR